MRANCGSWGRGHIQAYTGTGQNQGTKFETEARSAFMSASSRVRSLKKEREREHLLAIMAVYPKETMPINDGDQTIQI